jgi:hypothetical protein
LIGGFEAADGPRALEEIRKTAFGPTTGPFEWVL